MSDHSWIVESLGIERLHEATTEAARRRLWSALRDTPPEVKQADDRLRFTANALELDMLVAIGKDDLPRLRRSAASAFQIARVLSLPDSPMERAEALVRLGCLGILGDRGADVQRVLRLDDWGMSRPHAAQWGDRVWATVLHVWLLLFRKDGWDDLDDVQEHVAALRRDQTDLEPEFLQDAAARRDVTPAWHLIWCYHVAKAAEIVGMHHAQGNADGHYDVGEQLDAQFDRAVAAASHGGLVRQEALVRLLARTARSLVDSSIWSVARAVNSRVSEFVAAMTSKDRPRPIFEVLPPQRRALREAGLLSAGHRAVVVNLPTSSGKTLLAQFRMLQALNQFDRERGWVAYLAPTRALVGQLARRLRRDFADLGIVVEKVSPALEVDGVESDMLSEAEADRQFRVLVSTPEKLDLMLRGGWEEKTGRPLTLVVVDEAHGIGASERGFRLELLLATINRECRYAQFLLLTPFVPNAEKIAQWLAPGSATSIDFGVDWVPNDRVVAIAQPRRGEVRGDFTIDFTTQHTTATTIDIPDTLNVGKRRPLGLPWSAVSGSPGKLAAAAAHLLERRGTVIVLAAQPAHCWGIAETLKRAENGPPKTSDRTLQLCRFLEDEMGTDFPLVSLLENGIGVHHSGLSEDARAIVEWLAEQGDLRAMVATTTVAQGVNFPVSGVVFQSHQYPYGHEMPPEDFWNICGRAGRVDQDDLGVIALAGCNDAKVAQLREYVSRSVGELNSTLIDMIHDIDDKTDLLHLDRLAWRPEWSAFLQYLAHTYRQIGDHDRFAMQVEQVLRGTLGFRALRASHESWASKLVSGVHQYSERIRGKPLRLVDATGFSWESVARTLTGLNRAEVHDAVWTPDLFGTRRNDLERMVGLLLDVPELKGSLGRVATEAALGPDTVARVICDWVHERPLAEMAHEHFAVRAGSGGRDADATKAMTRCCQTVFGRLAQSASWGLAALQSLTMPDLDELSPDEQRTLRNLPARVYYGVNSDEAVTMRLLGVPRTAATPLARELNVRPSDPLHLARKKLREADAGAWQSALGDRGPNYRQVWTIMEGLE